nr:FCD domain-containing protein [uncultured Tolumonas sp.]
MFEPKRLYQEIGMRLRNELSSGQYKIGDRLPPERDIAEQFEVSRAVVREALIMLEIENLIEVRKGSGVYVMNLPEQQLAATGQTRDDDVGPFELLQARQFLESDIAAFAATQVTKNDIAQMRQALEMEKDILDSSGEDDDGDRLFHMLIAQSTGNSILAEIIEQLWLRRVNSPMWRKLHSRITDTSYRQEWLADHHKILAALQRKDPKMARQAMWQHLENVKVKLLELSDVEDPAFDGYLFESIPVAIVE